MRRWAVLRSGSMKALYMGYTVSDICSSRKSSNLQTAGLNICDAGTLDAAGQYSKRHDFEFVQTGRTCKPAG